LNFLKAVMHHLGKWQLFAVIRGAIVNIEMARYFAYLLIRKAHEVSKRSA
jgi:hypothetical protein